MSKISQYVLDRRNDPLLMDQDDWNRLEKAEAKRERRRISHAKTQESAIQVAKRPEKS